jgi:hypothetical protein
MDEQLKFVEKVTEAVQALSDIQDSIVRHLKLLEHRIEKLEKYQQLIDDNKEQPF